MATRTSTILKSTTTQQPVAAAPLKVSKLPKGSVLAFHYQPTRSIALG